MEAVIKFILAAACLILVLCSFKTGTVKSLITGGILSTALFFLLEYLKVLSMFKIGLNIFNLAAVFFLGIPGLTSLLFFNILSVI